MMDDQAESKETKMDDPAERIEMKNGRPSRKEIQTN